MTRKERLDKIIKFVEEKNKVSINDLATQFDLSPITMRLDIKKLASDGYLERSHGYVSISKNKFFLGGTINERIIEDNQVKKDISRKASELINPGDLIFLDDSSTVFNIINFITTIPGLTVATHSLQVMYALRNYPQIHMIGLGGTFCNTDQAFIGEATINTLKSMKFNISFMGCWSINEQIGTTETSNSSSAIKKVVASISNKNIILATEDKIKNKPYIETIKWENITKVITNSKIVKENNDKFIYV